MRLSSPTVSKPSSSYFFRLTSASSASILLRSSSASSSSIYCGVFLTSLPFGTFASSFFPGGGAFPPLALGSAVLAASSAFSSLFCFTLSWILLLGAGPFAFGSLDKVSFYDSMSCIVQYVRSLNADSYLIDTRVDLLAGRGLNRGFTTIPDTLGLGGTTSNV